MILSMTGAGKGTAQYEGKTITVFIKSLNSKQMDMSVRLPSCYRERELEIRNQIAEALGRGKVEVTISLDETSQGLSGVQYVNAVAVRHYYAQRDELLTAGIAPAGDLSWDMLLRLPGVLSMGEGSTADLSQAEVEALMQATDTAIKALIAFRQQEGAMLEQVLLTGIANISALLAEVDVPEAERIATVRTRLEEALEKISPEGIDRGRLEQELIYYIEKLDINEEKNRLRHHLSYFTEEVTTKAGNQGKTLGFIAQEIGREINTLGSKSNHATLQKLVVQMKDELEQIKEQVLNIL